MRTTIAALAIAAAGIGSIATSGQAHAEPVSVDTAKVTYVAKMTKRLAWVYVQAGPLTKRYELKRCRNDVLEECWVDYSGNRFDAHGKHAYAFIGDRGYHLPR